LQDLVGQSAKKLEVMRFATNVRIIRPGMAVTMDNSPQRLNIEINAAHTIPPVSCGYGSPPNRSRAPGQPCHPGPKARARTPRTGSPPLLTRACARRRPPPAGRRQILTSPAPLRRG